MSSNQYNRAQRDSRDTRDNELRESSPGVEKPNKPTVADQLVLLASEAELFHTPDGEAYATIPVDDHYETWKVASKGFRGWLLHRYFRATKGKSAREHALSEAIGTIAANAKYNGPELDVYVRVAGFDGNVYIDLGDTKWQAVEIRSDGWKIISNPPVKFRRPKTLLPLPAPVEGGNLNELRRHLNVDDAGWVLLVAWLVMAYRPKGPYPVLTLTGEQGTSKSTTARVLRSLIDPAEAPLRSEPRNIQDLMIAANNSWGIVFDNLSGLKGDLSDALCRLSTGGGFSTRKLYSDGEEVVFDAMRPVALTGISELATREDLLDRSVVVTLTPIPEDRRITEHAYWSRFNDAAPRILGALYSAVSTALKRFDSVHLERPPRMADFAQWVEAAEPSLPWELGAFMSVYETNRRDSIVLAVESNPVAAAVYELTKVELSWTGTATELLDSLEKLAPERVTQDKKAWPQSATALSRRLRRAATSLRALGVDVDPDGRNHNGRFITIRTIESSSSQRHSVTQPFLTSEGEGDAQVNLRGGDKRETSNNLPSDLVHHFAQDLSLAFDTKVELSKEEIGELFEISGRDKEVLQAAIICATDDYKWDDDDIPPIEVVRSVLSEKDHAALITEAIHLVDEPYEVWLEMKGAERQAAEAERYFAEKYGIASARDDEWEDE